MREQFGNGGGNGRGSAAGWAALGAGAAALLFAGRKIAMQAPTAMAADWVEGLTLEHKMVLKLLDRLADTDADDATERRLLLMKVKAALTKHALEEENVVYPALTEAGEADAVAELIGEHGEIKHHLYLFSKLEADAPDFRGRLSEFRALLSAHMDEEERHLFPALKARLGAEGNKALALAMNKEGLLAA